MKEGKTLATFNVKNGVYGVSGKVAKLTYMANFSKEANSDVKTIYGDGEIQYSAINDKGFTGTIGVTARDIDYEKEIGLSMDIDGGVAEVQIVKTTEHAIGFETEAIIDGVSKVKKVWAFGVETNRPSESLNQNTEGINESTVDYPITIKGVNLKDSGGSQDYVDENGHTLKVFTYSKMPTDNGYATFLDTVPEPKAKVIL